MYMTIVFIYDAKFPFAIGDATGANKKRRVLGTTACGSSFQEPTGIQCTCSLLSLKVYTGLPLFLENLETGKVRKL